MIESLYVALTAIAFGVAIISLLYRPTKENGEKDIKILPWIATIIFGVLTMSSGMVETTFCDQAGNSTAILWDCHTNVAADPTTIVFFSGMTILMFAFSLMVTILKAGEFITETERATSS